MTEIHPVDKHVGARVKLKRTMMGYSQDALASSIGVTFQQVQKYEQGSNRLSASRLYEIAKELGESIDYFYEGLAPTRAKPMMDFSLHESAAAPYDAGPAHDGDLQDAEGRDSLALMRAFRAIPHEEQRKSLIAMAKSIANQAILMESAS